MLPSRAYLGRFGTFLRLFGTFLVFLGLFENSDLQLLIVHLIMIATVLLSSQYISAIQDLAQGHRELHRREVIEMDTPLPDHRDNIGNMSGLQARLDRDNMQCPSGYFR